MPDPGDGRRSVGFLPEPSAPVAAALARGDPVVALETAILTHGLPRPRNLETSLAMEEAVRREGAVPATVGVLAGRVRVGLTSDEIERLAFDETARKCATRDLAPAVAAGASAGTTVSATLYLAVRAGIRVLATGGIGGVHRGGERSLDVSADLHELRRSPGVVVCSGVKAILDLARTMEMLETLSVTVLGYRTDRLPAFYVSRSDIAVHRVDEVEEIARTVLAQRALGWPGSLLVTRPPPADLALDRDVFEEMLARCRRRATRSGIRGAAETPRLLACLAELSEGRTVDLNHALAVANARLAAKIAVAVRNTG